MIDGFETIEAELYQYVTYRLSRVQAKLNAQATHMLREASGITLSQWRIIALIGAAGETRLSMLARHSALDKGLLSRNLKALVTEGIVLTKQDQTDHRAQLLSLSPKGKEIFNAPSRLAKETIPVKRNTHKTSLRRSIVCLKNLRWPQMRASRAIRQGHSKMTQPNFLVIMSDEHQARALGCAGHPFVKTPNLDALAARGVRFTNAYTPSPICVPARAAFAAGQPVNKTRLWDNAMPYTGTPKGWGHALQDKGVPVESIGKLHYRDAEDPAGFDVEHIPMQVVGGVGMVWASIRKEEERVEPKIRMLGDYIGPGHSKYTEYDAAVTKRTKDWFAERAASGNEAPWCLYVGLVAPHFPLVVPQEYFDLYPLDRPPRGETTSFYWLSTPPLGRKAKRQYEQRGQVRKRRGTPPGDGVLLWPLHMARS